MLRTNQYERAKQAEGHDVVMRQNSFQLKHSVELGDGSAVRRTCFTSRGPTFDFQHPHGALLSVTLVPEVPTSSSGFYGHRHVCGNIHGGKIAKHTQ